MPTPVSVARQCLTPDAAHALDEAVAVARRRGHGQTTSLHAVSALLSLPSSTLRDACARARNTAYSPRLQFKALELCLSVSLDRVQSSQLSDDPPVSNSLMAAIKRSQANQRRQPENYHLYQQISQHSSISCIKVELQHLILSILDDPVVSRVFGESGFRSSDIKLAIIRPLPQLLRYSRSRGPPLFLCNLPENSDSVTRRRGFSFPFPGFAGGYNYGDENCSRIGEVLVRNKGRNPLLVGVCAYDTLTTFINKKKDNVLFLPVELSGVNVISIEKNVTKFFTGGDNSKFEEEVACVVEGSVGGGVVVNYGDLKVFVSDDDDDDYDNEGVRYVVDRLTRLLQVHGGKVWLMGAVGSYETYLKFVSRFPSIEKDWDLQLLPIISVRGSLAESYPKSSLMESFVPFGGFFSTPSEVKSPLSNSYQCVTRCHLCNEKCEQEVIDISKGRSAASVADQYQSCLPSWLQMTELSTNKGVDVKTKDDGMVLSAKVTELQKKWDNICLRLHHTQPLPESNTYQVGSQFPTIVGFRFVEDKKENADNHSSDNKNALPTGNNCLDLNSCMPTNLQKMSTLQSKQWEKTSNGEDLESVGIRSPCSLSNSSVGDGSQKSPASVTSVTTDLGLGMCSAPTSTELKKPTVRNHIELPQDSSGCFSANVDVVNGSFSDHPAQSSSSSCHDFSGQFDPSNFKTLFSALAEKVGWQDEAIRIISQTIAHCRLRIEKFHGASRRGDIWFNFIGPDRCGKKKIAVALAEIMFGSRENFICADLSSQDGMIHTNALFNCQEVNAYDVKFRGKTVVDYVTGELCKKPFSVVFLENVDKADMLPQSTLSLAIQTGKFSDSHGREVGINNAIFVTTSTFTKDDQILSCRKESPNYSEERILRAKGWSMQLLVEHALGGDIIGRNLTLSVTRRNSNPVVVNKRKLFGMNENPEQNDISEMAKRAHKISTRNFDLNLPVEENEVQDTNDGHSDNDSISENSKAWLQDFSDQVDRTVFFKPFDFDALAKKVLNEINERFHKIVGSECLLEIDSRVMEQLLAAAYLSERSRVVEDWVVQVLSRGFVEVQNGYDLTAHSVVKLVLSEALLEEQTPGVRLPQKIILNSSYSCS